MLHARYQRRHRALEIVMSVRRIKASEPSPRPDHTAPHGRSQHAPTDEEVALSPVSAQMRFSKRRIGMGTRLHLFMMMCVLLKKKAPRLRDVTRSSFS